MTIERLTQKNVTVPKLSLRPPLTVIVTLEGLATSALGCYGCSWNQTPAIDSFAARGVVWDRWTSPIDHQSGLIRSWLRDSEPVIAGQNKRGNSVLLTDDQRLDLNDIPSSFSKREKLAWNPKQIPTQSVGETSIAKLFSKLLDSIDTKTCFAWLHSSVLRDCWDAPLESDEEGEEELTEPIEEGIETAEVQTHAPLALPISAAPPSLQLALDSHPDLIFQWLTRYAAQVRAIDELLESLSHSMRGRKLSVVVAGCSGFSLGENGWIGHHVGPLRSQDIRLPLILSSGGPLRAPSVANAASLPEILESLLNRQPVLTPTQWCDTGTPFEPSVHTISDRSKRAVTTPNWFYVNDEDTELLGEEHLYLKPDDVNDANDIARLRREVVNQLAGD